MVWEADHTVVCDASQWVMKEQLPGLGRATKQPLIDAGGHVDRNKSYRAYCPTCLLHDTSDVQTADPHSQYKTRAEREAQKTFYWKRPDAEGPPVAEPCMEKRTDPLPRTCNSQNSNLPDAPAAEIWASVTK